MCFHSERIKIIIEIIHIIHTYPPFRVGLSVVNKQPENEAIMLSG